MTKQEPHDITRLVNQWTRRAKPRVMGQQHDVHEMLTALIQYHAGERSNPFKEMEYDIHQETKYVMCERARRASQSWKRKMKEITGTWSVEMMRALTGETNISWVTVGEEGPDGVDYRCKEAECGAHKTIEKALPRDQDPPPVICVCDKEGKETHKTKVRIQGHQYELKAVIIRHGESRVHD